MATADGAKKTKKKAAQKKAAQSPRKTMSSDRLSDLKRTGVTAGKPSGTMAQRAKQNAGVADGTIRLGARGKTYNVYDAKTATWKRGVVSTTKKTSGEPPNRSQKAAKDSTESKNMRMGYQYGTKYGKPANPYSNQGASVTKLNAGQPKAIRPSGSPVPGSSRNNPRSRNR
jgi:hypothetical protein